MLGQHAMMPDLTLSQHFRSSEEPAPFPSGPNTSFLDPTPMPARFQESSLESHNLRHTNTKPEDPTYSTSSSEVGKLPLQGADFPIRWYGLRGEFTSAFFLGGKGPASKVSTGLKQPLATLSLETCILILAHATALALSLTTSTLALAPNLHPRPHPRPRPYAHPHAHAHLSLSSTITLTRSTRG